MLLDELDWFPALPSALKKYSAYAPVPGSDQGYIYHNADGTYHILMWGPYGEWTNMDQLTAQCVLFHITHGGNDAA